MAVEEAATLGPYAVRRVKAEEWQRPKELRLEALRDPIAHLAFLDPIEDALERPESFWRERAETAGGGATVAQFVAVAERTMWLAP